MQHSIKKIPPFWKLPLSEWINLIWFHLFINNRVKWFLSSLSFTIKCFFLGIHIDQVRTYGKVNVYRAPLSTINIKKNCQIITSESRGNACTLYARARLRTLTPSASIEIGENTGMNGISITARTKKISLGKNCRIGPNVVIIDSDYHAEWPPYERKTNPGFEYDMDVIIGDNVWIGMNSIILKGANIGENTIIGAGSIVTGTIPSDCLAAGVPAKFIRKLGE